MGAVRKLSELAGFLKSSGSGRFVKEIVERRLKFLGIHGND